MECEHDAHTRSYMQVSLSVFCENLSRIDPKWFVARAAARARRGRGADCSAIRCGRRRGVCPGRCR